MHPYPPGTQEEPHYFIRVTRDFAYPTCYAVMEVFVYGPYKQVYLAPVAVGARLSRAQKIVDALRYVDSLTYHAPTNA